MIHRKRDRRVHFADGVASGDLAQEHAVVPHISDDVAEVPLFDLLEQESELAGRRLHRNIARPARVILRLIGARVQAQIRARETLHFGGERAGEC